MSETPAMEKAARAMWDTIQRYRVVIIDDACYIDDTQGGLKRYDSIGSHLSIKEAQAFVNCLVARACVRAYLEALADNTPDDLLEFMSNDFHSRIDTGVTPWTAFIDTFDAALRHAAREENP